MAINSVTSWLKTGFASSSRFKSGKVVETELANSLVRFAVVKETATSLNENRLYPFVPRNRFAVAIG